MVLARATNHLCQPLTTYTCALTLFVNKQKNSFFLSKPPPGSSQISKYFKYFQYFKIVF